MQRLLGERITKLVGNGRTVFIGKPPETGADWDWDVGYMRWARKDEKRLASSGVPLGSRTVILPSRHQSPIRNRQSVVVLRRDVYGDLPRNVKTTLSDIWTRLEADRKFEKLVTKKTGIFLFTAADNQPELQNVEEELSRGLEEWGAGYVTTDVFEIDLLKRMLDTKNREKHSPYDTDFELFHHYANHERPVGNSQ
jgi:hypothetical protein